jgi:hypothetical protein
MTSLRVSTNQNDWLKTLGNSWAAVRVAARR